MRDFEQPSDYMLITFSRGFSFGEAPLASILQVAFDKLTSDKALFHSHEAYLLPVYSGLQSMRWLREGKLKAAGFLALCMIVHLQKAPGCISPLLLWFIMDGPSGFGIDMDFLLAVQPSIHVILSNMGDMSLTGMDFVSDPRLMAFVAETGVDVRVQLLPSTLPR